MNNNELKMRLEGLKGENNLINGVIEIALNNIEDYDDGIEYFEDVLNYGCGSGIVTELIHHHDTSEFFNKYSEEILDLYNELTREIGPINMELNENNLAWFAFEETARYIYNEVNC